MLSTICLDLKIKETVFYLTGRRGDPRPSFFMLHRLFLWYNYINYNYAQRQYSKDPGITMETDTQYDNKEMAAEKLATASMVLGIISLFSILCCCPFVFSAIGIVLALLSKGASDTLRPRAKTGLILSIVGIAVSFILLTFSIAFPILMYRTNPEFRKNFDNAMIQSLEQDEELFRSLYGDDAYEQMEELIKGKEDSL